MTDQQHGLPTNVFDNATQATMHSTVYGCSIAIHRPNDQGRMWSCTNPRCPIGPIGWITEQKETA